MRSPWGREGRDGPEGAVIRLLSQDQPVHRGKHIRRGRDVARSPGIRPDLAHARYCSGPFSAVARRGVCAGLEGA
jgi:hypothetical protein